MVKGLKRWEWTQGGWKSEPVEFVEVPPSSFPCETCGNPNCWADAQVMKESWSPFRMCHDCLGHDPAYGEVRIEFPAQVIEIDKKFIPKDRKDWNSGEGSNPRWRLVDRKLHVEQHSISFFWNKGSW